MANDDRSGVADTRAKIIARAWQDPAYKAKLLADPDAALKDAGVSVPAGIKVSVVEDTETCVHLVLPPAPTGPLSDDALQAVAGGGTAPNGGTWAQGFNPDDFPHIPDSLNNQF